jgi:hypothetical protein
MTCSRCVAASLFIGGMMCGGDAKGRAHVSCGRCRIRAHRVAASSYIAAVGRLAHGSPYTSAVVGSARARDREGKLNREICEATPADTPFPLLSRRLWRSSLWIITAAMTKPAAVSERDSGTIAGMMPGARGFYADPARPGRSASKADSSSAGNAA